MQVLEAFKLYEKRLKDANALDFDDLLLCTIRLFEEKVIAGGMIPKVECCIDAIHRGVERVIIMDGRVPHSILMEILTDEGAGTMVYGEETELCQN